MSSIGVIGISISSSGFFFFLRRVNGDPRIAIVVSERGADRLDQLAFIALRANLRNPLAWQAVIRVIERWRTACRGRPGGRSWSAGRRWRRASGRPP